jgi:hypothetical protein
MIGWYSEKQSAVGLFEYATPDGGRALVTQVTPGDGPACAWDDIVRVGEVTEWVRTIVWPPRIEYRDHSRATDPGGGRIGR